MRDDHRTGAAASGDDVDHTRRQSRFGDDFSKEQCAETSIRRRLEHNRIAHRNRRRDLPRQHQQRKVPRDDLSHHADRLIIAQFGFHQLRPTRIIRKVTRQQWHINIAQLADGFAIVHQLQHRQQAMMFLNVARNRIHVTRADYAGSFAPRFKCSPRRGNSLVNFFLSCLNCFSKQLAIRRIVRRIILRAFRRDPFVVDEQSELAIVFIQPRIHPDGDSAQVRIP